MSRRRFLVNAPAGRRALRPNRMQRPTAAYRRAHPLAYQRDWGDVPPAEAARIYETAMLKGAPSWLRPPAAREKLPAPYDREQARREYQSAIRGPIAHGHAGERLALGRNPRTRYRVQRRTFGSLDAAREYANKHFARTGIVLAIEAVKTPKRRRGKAGRNPAPLEARNMARRRSRSRRRKGSARRPRRRAVARVTLSNPHRKRRRGAYMRRSAHRGRTRHFRRNPARGGFAGRLIGALGNGLTVSGGQVVQNAIVRYVPDLVPATVPQAGLLNSALKDVAGILVGCYGADKLLGTRRAEFFVAGQASAAVNRVIRAANIPQVSTLLGEYDPIRLGIYSRGVTRQPPAIAPGSGNGANSTVRTLKNVGVYTDGVAYSPSLY